MVYLLKGNTLRFCFEKADNENLLKLIFEKDLFLYKNTVNCLSQQIPLTYANCIEDSDPHYWIVPNFQVPFVKWRTVKLTRGDENFVFDNLNSRAVQLLLPKQTPNRIGTGRIALTSEWMDHNETIHQATFEKDVYKTIQGFIRRLSAGKIGGTFIGENAFKLWETNQIELCYDLSGKLTYNKNDFKKKGKKSTP